MNLSPEQLSALAERFGWVFLHSLWQGALIAALLCTALILLRRQNAALRHVLCLFAFGGLLASAASTFIFLRTRGIREAEATRLSAGAALLDASSPASSASANWDEQVIGSEVVADLAPMRARRWNSEAAVSASRRGPNAWPAFVSLFWAVGAGLLSLRRFSGWRRLGIWRRAAVPAERGLRQTVERLAERFGARCTVAVVDSAAALTPMLVGLLKPMILLPAQVVSGLSTTEVEAILAHELAHLVRRDAWGNLFQVAVETLFFYHPAIWWIGGRARDEREAAADDLALQICADRRVYAGALLRLAEASQAPSLALAASGGSLLHRVRRIVHPTTTEPLPGGWSLPGFVIAALAVGFWVTQVNAEDGNVISVQEGQSLQTAIDAAPAGATLRLGPGVWKERIAVNKPLTIEGAGWEKTSIIPNLPPPDSTPETRAEFDKQFVPSLSRADRAKLTAERAAKFERPALKIQNVAGVTVRKIRIGDGADAKQSGQDCLVSFRHAEATLEDCAIVGPFGNGIQLSNESVAEIHRSLIAALWGEGIIVEGGGSALTGPSRLHLAESEVRNVYHYGIVLGPGCDKTVIEHCRISGTAWHGIRYDDASPTISGNVIFANARSGIYASGETHATVRGNLFWKNEMDGISCWFANTDTIEGNTFVGNLREGLLVVGGAKPNVSKNLFTRNPIAVAMSATQSRNGTVSPVGAPILSNNAFWENKTAIQEKADQKPAPEGSSTADPGFRDPAKNDFALSPASPARAANIGAADPLSPAGSSWSLLTEEQLIIPDSETRDFAAWKKPQPPRRSKVFTGF